MARETWAQANRRMACIDCGKSGAQPYVTTKGANPGRNVRICDECSPRWVEYGLKERAPTYEEPGAVQAEEAKPCD